MPLLEVPGAELFYETHGSGPLLLCIPAAGGEGKIFHQTAQHLSANFTVITYDRRGFSQSLLHGDQDYSKRLQRDADDAAELIKHVASTNSNANANGTSPVYVFGSSSGAIVALNLLCQHPDLATKVIVHEAPLTHALPEPEATEESKALWQIHDIYLARGVHAAMGAFLHGHIEPEDIPALVGGNPRENPYVWGNLLYWFDREFVYTGSEIPWAVLEDAQMKQKFIPGVSENGAKRLAARCTHAMAEKLGVGTSTFAGAHMGYLTKPEEFADSLKKSLAV